MIRKVSDWTAIDTKCRHPNHKPPTHIVLSPGVWEHTCPGCQSKTLITIPKATL